MTFHLCIYLHLLHSAWHIIGAQQMSVEQNYWSFKSRKKEYQRKTQRQAREWKMTVPRKMRMVGEYLKFVRKIIKQRIFYYKGILL